MPAVEKQAEQDSQVRVVLSVPGSAGPAFHFVLLLLHPGQCSAPKFSFPAPFPSHLASALSSVVTLYQLSLWEAALQGILSTPWEVRAPAQSQLRAPHGHN